MEKPNVRPHYEVNAMSPDNHEFGFNPYFSNQHSNQRYPRPQLEVETQQQVPNKLNGWSSDYLEDIFESIPEVLLVFNTQGKVESFNELAKNTLGYSGDELSDRDVHDLIIDPKGEIERYFCNSRIELWEEVKRTKKLETYMLLKNHEKLPVELSLSPLQNGEGIICVVRNISQRITAKDDYFKILQSLRNKNKELREFAFLLSHGLKTPLRGISTLVNWLHEDNSDILEEDAFHKLSLLKTRTHRLASSIDDTFKYSKIGHTNHVETEINLNELILEIADSLDVSEQVALDIEHLPTITGSRVHMTQLFQNLISNAITHSGREDVTISIRSKNHKKQWEFFVQDNGKGIAAKHHKRVFKIFQTLIPKKSDEGNGVGLTIVNKIVEMYGGKVWVDSKEGEGARFAFTIDKMKKPYIDN